MKAFPILRDQVDMHNAFHLPSHCMFGVQDATTIPCAVIIKVPFSLVWHNNLS